jgi:hypothetical protein
MNQTKNSITEKCDFGDQRLTKRAMFIESRLSLKYGKPLSAIFERASDLKRAYEFFANAKTSLTSVCEPYHHMNLFNHYCQDIEEFANSYGRPIDHRYWAESLVPRTLKIAKNLFHGAETEEASDGSVLVALDNGSLLALICMPDKRLGAFATRVGKTYFVAIKFGLIRLLFNLSLATWRNQRFLSDIKPYARDAAYLDTDFIPPGFEEIFLYDEFSLSDQIRHAVFYRCFEQAVSFFWLHEVAHVLRGHIDICAKRGEALRIIDEFLNVAELDEDEPDTSIQNIIPYHAFEIEADRWALDKLFGALHQRIKSTSADDLDLIATAIGCTLFPLSLHGYNLLRNQSDFARHHPPIWFRADDVLTAEDKAANDLWFSTTQGEKNFERFRFRQKNLVQCGLASLSRLHPMFGDWLSPVAELSRKPEVQRVLDAANVLFEPWRSDLSHYRRSIKISSQSSSL